MSENRLTERHLRNAKPAAKDTYLGDGGGLYGRVLKADPDNDKTPDTDKTPRAEKTPRANKKILFQYRYKIDGKTGYFHCGTYPVTSLAEARTLRDQARKLVRNGIHPAAHQRRERQEHAAAEQAAQMEKTVAQLHEDWQKIYLSHHRRDKGELVKQFMESDVLPYIGKLKAKDVTRKQLVQVIDRITERGARRKANAVLSMLKQMFKHGLARGFVDIDPLVGLTKLHAGGKEQSRERNLSCDEVTALHIAIPEAGMHTSAEAAVWLLLATGVRTKELLHAPWSEFDLIENTWLIPVARSKIKKTRPHLVHLSSFALRQLAILAKERTGAFLFNGRKLNHPVSDKWLSKIVRDRQRKVALKKRSSKTGSLLLAGGEWTPHDLRRTMASRMGDETIPPHVIEKCMNHELGGQIAVYQQQEYLAERKEAFERWGNRLDGLTKTATKNTRTAARKTK